MNSKILLSVCIPTFNRSALLRQTIDSIVTDPLFASNKVEIVVSDNASTDDTESLLENYCTNYRNIRYSKNLINNGFMNIITVLNLARGELLKVINDYTIFNNNTLETLLLLVESNIETKPQIFLGNGILKSKSKRYCFSFDRFLSIISYWCTFVGGYCVWKEDFNLIKYKAVNEMFPHTSLLFLLTNKKKYLIDNKILFTNQELKTKGGYNLFNVFSVQFFDMLVSIKNKGCITEITFKKIKKDMFYHFFIVWYYKLVIKKSNQFHFEYKDIKKYFNVHYSFFDYIKLCFFGHMYFLVILRNRISLCLKRHNF